MKLPPRWLCKRIYPIMLGVTSRCEKHPSERAIVCLVTKTAGEYRLNNPNFTKINNYDPI
jgi:hypothetical protein